MLGRMQRKLQPWNRMIFRYSHDSSSGVTRKNFQSALKQIKSLLPRSDFVAVDLEMSGMHSAPWRKSMELDTVETRYQNVRDSAEKFSLLQCGLCLFRYDLSRATFVAYPYNFFLFPRNELSLERDFLCQTSSLEFLAKHRFDFNTCIYEGISYLSKKDEKKARSLMAKKAEEENSTPDMSLHRTSDLMFSERVRLEVGLWRTAKIMAKHKKLAAGESVATCSFPTLIVNIAEKRQAKLVVQVVSRNFEDLIPVVEDGDEVTQVKVLYTGSAQQKNELEVDLEKEKEEIMETDLNEAVGFRHVIDALIESKTPIVGHNCILDFAHIHSKFIGPLPEDYSSFCSTVHQYFPAIVDTKYMLKAQPIKEVGLSVTALYPVYKYFFGAPKKGGKSKPFPKVAIEVASGYYKYPDSDLKHEAGFDAYMTGAVFAQMWRLISGKNSELQSLSEKIARRTSGVADYANLLYLGWAGHFVLDMTTGKEAQGTKALPERSSGFPFRPASDATVLVWSRSSLGTPRQLQKLVKSCFDGMSLVGEVEVIQIDDNASFLAFQSVRSMNEFYRAFESIKGSSQDQLSPMATKLAATGLKVTLFETFERLCKSQLTTRTLADAIQMLKRNEEAVIIPDFSIEEESDALEEYIPATVHV